VFANAVGGFVPNTTSADADFGKALQCAAIDRARYKVDPALQRSAVCEEQFERYCWNPNNLASVSELPGRKLNFVDPDSEGIPAVRGFLSQSQQKQQKIAFIIGFVFLGLVIAVVSGLLCVYYPFGVK
jgi:lysophospholipase